MNWKDTGKLTALDLWMLLMLLISGGVALTVFIALVAYLLRG